MAFGNPLTSYFVGLYPGTPAELALEPHIAALGLVYRTQYPFYLFEGGLKYFPDVLLPTIGFIIEVDDSGHDDPEQQAADAERTRKLEEYGWRVVRCTNEEALRRPQVVMNRLQLARETLGDRNIGFPEAREKKKKRKKPLKASPARKSKGYKKCLLPHYSFLLH